MRRNVCLSDIALNELRQSCFVYENCFVFFSSSLGTKTENIMKRRYHLHKKAKRKQSHMIGNICSRKRKGIVGGDMLIAARVALLLGPIDTAGVRLYH